MPIKLNGSSTTNQGDCHEYTRRILARGVVQASASGQSMRQFCGTSSGLPPRPVLAARLEEHANAPLSFAVLQLSTPPTPPEPEPPSDSGVAVECGGHLVRLSRQFDESVCCG
jgi:hypothetical protein